MALFPKTRQSFPEFRPGEVWLIGAGPGDPHHLTMLAYHALQSADVVVYDALVDKRILDFIRPGAETYFVGKRGGKPSAHQRDINDTIIALAKDGRRVARLRSVRLRTRRRGGGRADPRQRSVQGGPGRHIRACRTRALGNTRNDA